jgi:hypothetical protein
MNKDEFMENREFLKSKKIIIDYAADSIEDAGAMIKEARGL